LAISLLVLSLLASFSIPRGSQEVRSALEEQINQVPDPSAMPVFPSPATQLPTEEEKKEETGN
jgi:hypothetical protein